MLLLLLFNVIHHLITHVSSTEKLYDSRDFLKEFLNPPDPIAKLPSLFFACAFSYSCWIQLCLHFRGELSVAWSMCLLLPGFSDHHSSLFDLFSRNTDIKRGVFLEYHLLSNLAWKNKCYCFLLAPKYISTKHICCWHAAVGDSGHGGKWKDKASTLSQIIRLHENTAFMPHKGCSMTAGLSLTLAVPHDSPQTIALHFFRP